MVDAVCDCFLRQAGLAHCQKAPLVLSSNLSSCHNISASIQPSKQLKIHLIYFRLQVFFSSQDFFKKASRKLMSSKKMM